MCSFSFQPVPSLYRPALGRRQVESLKSNSMPASDRVRRLEQLHVRCIQPLEVCHLLLEAGSERSHLRLQEITGHVTPTEQATQQVVSM
eukprot:m.497776 g.497776  ORF g.497776 m.497776 type:complete len:89 (+) comp57315_c0_seq11:61-327(+)